MIDYDCLWLIMIDYHCLWLFIATLYTINLSLRISKLVRHSTLSAEPKAEPDIIDPTVPLWATPGQLDVWTWGKTHCTTRLGAGTNMILNEEQGTATTTAWQNIDRLCTKFASAGAKKRSSETCYLVLLYGGSDGWNHPGRFFVGIRIEWLNPQILWFWEAKGPNLRATSCHRILSHLGNISLALNFISTTTLDNQAPPPNLHLFSLHLICLRCNTATISRSSNQFATSGDHFQHCQIL